MATAAKRPPFQVTLSAEDFQALLKNARRQSPVARRLIAAEDGRTTGTILVTGSGAEGLALRAVALAHAPKAVPAIDKALKEAESGKGKKG